MTVGRIPVRTFVTLFVLAVIPLLMAITILFPANAGGPAMEVEDGGRTPDTFTETETPDVVEGFEVVRYTGEIVTGHESKMSAIVVRATSED